MNKVKIQAMSEVQKAVAEAEQKAFEVIATERARMEQTIADVKRQAINWLKQIQAQCLGQEFFFCNVKIDQGFRCSQLDSFTIKCRVNLYLLVLAAVDHGWEPLYHWDLKW